MNSILCGLHSIVPTAMTNQWPATPSLQWTNGGASSNHLPAVAEPQRLESIQARLHPLDTALSNSEPLPSVRQLLAATPSPSTAGDQLSGSSIQRRWDPMVQSPASDRSSAISGRAALSDILSGKAQASPRNPFATFHNTAQYISPTSDTDRQQSAPLRQRSPPQQLHNLQSAQYPSFLKREAAPIEPMHETAPMFKNPFPEAPIHLRLSNSISPQYTPSPQAQPSVLQPGLPSHGPYYGSSGSWSQQPDISTGRGYNQQIPVSQAGSQSIFSNPELIDTSRPGPAIQVDDRFLPRFLREEYLPDEGLCYFYDDGRHCKAVINSERVNPYWGVTKAGKPRKRLILACRSCRDKKIKCQPDYPKCEQCNKFGRECRFTTV